MRLFTASRNNRFTYDANSEVTYRHEQASEETYYMTAYDRFMSDVTVSDQGGGSAQSSSEFETEGSVSNWTDAIFGRPDAKVQGEFSGQSSFDFFRELRRHAESSHERSVQGTRAASSIAMGEVQSRSHAEGESESAYEAATRVIENKNCCHAVTYFAYQLVKRQTMTFRIKSVLRRVIDPAGDVGLSARPLQPNTNVAVIPGGVLSTDTARLEVETTARTAAASQKAGVIGNLSSAGGASLFANSGNTVLASNLRLSSAVRAKPISDQVRNRALQAVDADLVKAGVLDKVGGQLSARLAAEMEFSRTTCLPTQGIVVKGCIDQCNVCEESLQKDIALDLERKALENKMLEKQIAILEQSQEYRCCPADEEEHPQTS